jgi:hypothetical protein
MQEVGGGARCSLHFAAFVGAHIQDSVTGFKEDMLSGAAPDFQVNLTSLLGI